VLRVVKVLKVLIQEPKVLKVHHLKELKELKVLIQEHKVIQGHKVLKGLKGLKVRQQELKGLKVM
jgi:hypothetical protein